MKKLLAILMAGAMIVSLASCGGQGDSNNSKSETESKAEVTTTEAKKEDIAGKVIFNGEETSLEKINEEFNSNEVVAEEKYEDTPMIFIDKITSIQGGAYILDHHYDCVIDTENGLEVAGDFDVSELKVGDMIKVKGYLFAYFGRTFEIYEINDHDVSVELYNE